MECDICQREHDAQALPFLCAVDARNRIYQPRMNHVQLLIQSESLQQQVNDDLAAVTSDLVTPSSYSWTSSSNGAAAVKSGRTSVDAAASRQRAAEDRTDGILAAAEALRNDIKAARDEIRERKAAIARRRADLTAVSGGLAERREAQQKKLQKAILTSRWSWKQNAQEFAMVRTFLCGEAAKLYGLEERSADDGSGLHEYRIGRVPITDLASMNSVTPEVLSSSLAHISHLLLITCNYLAVRLPAEITLPHRDYPRPTIFNLVGSYNHGSVPFQNTAGIATSSSETRIADSQHGPRPRPLFIEKPLQQLAKEDSVSYSFFLEGVSLLAYDIAWLCSSQGVPVGETASFDDICHIGRNLHKLLLSPRPGHTPGDSQHTDGKPSTLDRNKSPGEQQSSWFGEFSHGTMYDYMGGAPGTDPARAIKLQNPIKLVDQLRRRLVGDSATGDWEVIGDDFLKMSVSESPMLVENQRVSSDKAANGDAVKSSPKAGSNGWMRVKNR